MDRIPRTVFFEVCRGVFEGGGCRAPAHVGAYVAAIEAGVNFSQVAGTSAGSIVAALVGAGGSPEYLEEHFGRLKFSELLSPPTGQSIVIGNLRKLLKIVPFARRSMVKRIIAYGGAFSSARIQQWIDDRLAELLPDAQRPVTFSALPIPTSVVATDLAGGRPKTWSTALTPGEPVGLAVRCSCSIPLFFEPVPVGNSLFVDGGVLSNLPTFVFSQSNPHDDLGGPILAFSLTDDSPPPAEWPHSVMLRALMDTVVGGATEIQSALQSDVNIVSIPTGTIKATDFHITEDEVADLVDRGRRAVFAFIDNEAHTLRQQSRADIHYQGEDRFFAELVREARVSGEQLVCSMPDTLWFWQLFPTVLTWCVNGADLQVFLRPASGQEDNLAREKQRRGLLAALGASIHENDTLPFYGFLLRRSGDNRDALFLKNPSATEHASFGAVYVGAHHRPIISTIEKHLVTPKAHTGPQIKMQPSPPQQIIDKLKSGVWQYARDGVTIDLEEVSLDRVSMLVRCIRTFKYVQIDGLAKLYDAHNVPRFAPAAVVVDGQTVSYTTPPVLEEWGSRLVAVEGNTRALYMHKKGAGSIWALVARGVREPLPGRPVTPERTLLYTRRLEPSQRIDGFNYAQFRSIEGAARPLETQV
jgi:predicted acylesterase/phospholipase RssA